MADPEMIDVEAEFQARLSALPEQSDKYGWYAELLQKLEMAKGAGSSGMTLESLPNETACVARVAMEFSTRHEAGSHNTFYGPTQPSGKG